MTTHDITDEGDAAQLARFSRHIDDRLAGNGARIGVRHAELFRALIP